MFLEYLKLIKEKKVNVNKIEFPSNQTELESLASIVDQPERFFSIQKDFKDSVLSKQFLLTTQNLHPIPPPPPPPTPGTGASGSQVFNLKPEYSPSRIDMNDLTLGQPAFNTILIKCYEDSEITISITNKDKSPDGNKPRFFLTDVEISEWEYKVVDGKLFKYKKVVFIAYGSLFHDTTVPAKAGQEVKLNLSFKTTFEDQAQKYNTDIIIKGNGRFPWSLTVPVSAEAKYEKPFLWIIIDDTDIFKVVQGESFKTILKIINGNRKLNATLRVNNPPIGVSMPEYNIALNENEIQHLDLNFIADQFAYPVKDYNLFVDVIVDDRTLSQILFSLSVYPTFCYFEADFNLSNGHGHVEIILGVDGTWVVNEYVYPENNTTIVISFGRKNQNPPNPYFNPAFMSWQNSVRWDVDTDFDRETFSGQDAALAENFFNIHDEGLLILVSLFDQPSDWDQIAGVLSTALGFAVTAAALA